MLERLFLRNVRYESWALKRAISRYLKSKNFKLKEIEHIIESIAEVIGVGLPVEVKGFDGKVLKGITADHKNICIALSLHEDDIDVKFDVTCGEKIFCYLANIEKGFKGVPKVTLSSILTVRADKELTSRYEDNFCSQRLKFCGNHELEIEVRASGLYLSDDECGQIETYLLDLEDPLNVVDVYKRMKKYLNFSEYEFRYICISYLKDEELCGRVIMQNKKIEEYLESQPEEKFHFHCDESFEYSKGKKRLQFKDGHLSNDGLKDKGSLRTTIEYLAEKLSRLLEN